MSKITIDIDSKMLKEARELTGLKSKSEIVNAALDLLVRTESRKGMLSYFGSGVWDGDLRRYRRNRTTTRPR